MSLYAIGERAPLVTEDRTVLVVTGLGERPVIRSLLDAAGARVVDTTPRALATATVARLFVERASAQRPDAVWRVVNDDELRKLLGEPPRRRRKAYETHAEATDRAERAREDRAREDRAREDTTVTTWRKT